MQQLLYAFYHMWKLEFKERYIFKVTEDYMDGKEIGQEEERHLKMWEHKSMICTHVQTSEHIP